MHRGFGVFIAFALLVTVFIIGKPSANAADPDGTIDQSFPTRPNSNVVALLSTSDNGAIIGGTLFDFQYNGVSVAALKNLAKLKPTGEIDTTFNANIANGALSAVSTLAFSGSDIIAGHGNAVARIDQTGLIDTAFKTNVGAAARKADGTTAGVVYSVAVQADGKILVGGDFASFNSHATQNLVRLNSDGTVDTSFSSQSGIDNIVRKVLVQPDQKILVGGNFTTFQSANATYLVRLNANGTVDTSFKNPSISPAGSFVTQLGLQSDGKIIIGGQFSSVDGTSRPNLARLNVDGSLDQSFGDSSNLFFQWSTAISALWVNANDSLLIGSGMTSPFVVRVTKDGVKDTTFSTAITSGGVSAIAVQASGNILVGGGLQTANTKIRRLARLAQAPLVPTVTVTFDAKGGSSSKDSDSFIVGSEGITTLPTATRIGYSFNGWSAQESGGTAVTAPYVPETDLTLYAQWTKTGNVITYDTQGGTAINPAEVLFGDSTTLPTANRTGYNFIGWFDAKSGGTKIGNGGDQITPQADVTLFAQWEAITNTITFDAQGGTAQSPVLVSFGSSTVLPNPVLTGYQLTGWYTQQSGGIKIGNGGDSYSPTADITLYAQWQLANYPVYFEVDGGSAVSSTSYQFQDGFTIPAAPTKTGNRFIGWYTAPSGGTKIGDPGQTYKPGTTGAVTIHARWLQVHTVNLDLQGSISDIAAIQGNTDPAKCVQVNSSSNAVCYPAVDGGYVDIPSFTTKNGYKFAGWYTQPNGQGDKLIAGGYPGAAFWPSLFYPQGDVTFYAYLTLENFTVYLNANGGSVADGSLPYNINSQSVELPNPTRTGYSFTGWNSHQNPDDIDAVKIASPYVPYDDDGAALGNHTIYAQWEPNSYAVSFETHGGSSVADSSYLADQVMLLPAAPTRDGHEFMGWSAVESGGTKFGAGSPYSPGKYEPITIHAIWGYQISYELNGGSLAGSAVIVEVGESIELPEPTRVGYEFKGWFDSASGGTKIGDPYNNFNPTAAATLHAQWEAKKYPVTFNTRGGNSIPNGEYATDGSLNLPGAPFLQDHTFLGWYLEESGGSPISSPYKPIGVGPLTLYARWSENPTQQITWMPITRLMLEDGAYLPSGSEIPTSDSADAVFTFSVLNANTTRCTVDKNTGEIKFEEIGSCTIKVEAAATSTHKANYKTVTFDVAHVETKLELQVAIKTGEPIAGGQVYFAASGLALNTPWNLVLQSDPVILASGVTNEIGEVVTGEAKLPDGLSPGWHSLTLNATGSDGKPTKKVTWFEVGQAGLLEEITQINPDTETKGKNENKRNRSESTYRGSGESQSLEDDLAGDHDDKKSENEPADRKTQERQSELRVSLVLLVLAILVGVIAASIWLFFGWRRSDDHD